MKFYVLLIMSFSLNAVASEDYTFCQKENTVITLNESAEKVVVESENYTAYLTNNQKAVVVIYNPSKTKDKYLPRVEITTTSGNRLTLRESTCNKFQIIDLAYSR